MLARMYNPKKEDWKERTLAITFQKEIEYDVFKRIMESDSIVARMVADDSSVNAKSAFAQILINEISAAMEGL
ncbi:hypothetical protein HN682_09745 [Candidatus Peregrinibacteria bacterium]|jgi:hypothetical protein|nr:hypothetical protein [Candidatus Peregrinibacteria bacterium]